MQDDDVRTLFSRLGANKVHLQSKYVFQIDVPKDVPKDVPVEEPAAAETCSSQEQNTLYECCAERLGAPEDLRARVIGACLNDATWRKALRRKRHDQEMLELLNRADHDELFVKYPDSLQKVAQICGVNFMVFDGFAKRAYEVVGSDVWEVLRASSHGRFELFDRGDEQQARDRASADRKVYDLVLSAYGDMLKDLPKKRVAEIARLCSLLDVPMTAHKSKAEQIDGIERRVKEHHVGGSVRPGDGGGA